MHHKRSMSVLDTVYVSYCTWTHTSIALGQLMMEITWISVTWNIEHSFSSLGSKTGDVYYGLTINLCTVSKKQKIYNTYDIILKFI